MSGSPPRSTPRQKLDKGQDSKTDKSFQERRKSFFSNADIRQKYAKEETRKSLTMRRKSRFYSPAVDQRDLLNHKTRVIISWTGLTVTIKQRIGWFDRLFKKAKESKEFNLVENICGVVSPGELCAIMGPTGSGKTTVLKALAGISDGSVTGSVLLNGLERDSDWKYIMAYIEAGSAHLEQHFTVREALTFAAELCLPERYSADEKKARIDHCLKMMGLERVSDSVIGISGEHRKCISGGERKRLCIALELIREPKVLFLDEPTSGLDAATASTIITYLHRLAIVDSLTIIMTIHQPRMSILSKYSQICLLAKGHQVYGGTVDEAIEFFQEIGYPIGPHENPAECLLDSVRLISSEKGTISFADLKTAWTKEYNYTIKPLLQRPVSQPPERRKKGNEFYISRWREIKLLVWREHIVNTRTFNYLYYLSLLYLFNGLLIGFLWFQLSKTDVDGVQNRVGLIGTVPMDSFMLEAINAVCLGIARTQQERIKTIYRGSSMFIAIYISAIPVTFFVSLIYYVPAYYITGLRYSPFTAFLVFTGLNYLHSILEITIGVIIGSIVADYTAALIVGCIVSFIFRLFSGLSVNLSEVTWILRWISYLSPIFYTTQGLAQNEFDGQILAGQPGEVWLSDYALDLISTIWSAGGMLIFIFVNIALGYLIYEYRTKPGFKFSNI